jgi:hypothetical protein
MVMRILIVYLLFATFPFSGSSETFFVYLQEADNQEATAESGFPVREGLFGGLFDLNHIVFDDVRANYRIGWSKGEFKKLINTAADGGANYLVAVRVTNQSTPFKEDVARIKSSVHYYCFEVKKELLIGCGELKRDNWGREQEINQERLGQLLGQDLSLEIDRICRDYR